MPARPAKLDGSVSAGAPVTILGQSIPTKEVKVGGRLRQVIYGGWLTVGQNLALILWLEAPEGKELTLELVEQGRQVVESLKLADGSTQAITVGEIP